MKETSHTVRANCKLGYAIHKETKTIEIRLFSPADFEDSEDDQELFHTAMFRLATLFLSMVDADKRDRALQDIKAHVDFGNIEKKEHYRAESWDELTKKAKKHSTKKDNLN